MTEKTSTSKDDQFAAQLEACERMLDAGVNPDSTIIAESGASHDVQARLKGGLSAVRRLKRMWRSQTPPGALGSHRLGSADRGGDAVELAHPATIGRFQIRRELGRGGYGIVFLAYDPTLHRDIALKLPRADVLVTPELRQRFQQEARAAAALDHPNVVSVYEAGSVGPVCYIASAYCPGVTLAEWIKQRGEPVPPADAAQLVATLAEAVDHAHRHGVLHRDLKPSNVLLEEVESRGLRVEGQNERLGPRPPLALNSQLSTLNPKITDFGLAKLMAAGHSAQTHSGAVMGTPSYMAPEQARGKPREIGLAADVYSLGAILYELVTGRPPFQGDSPMETLHQVQSIDPVPPRRLRPKLPRDLETICLKCLEKNATDRYPDASGLAEDLRHFLVGDSIRARPAAWWERAVKWARPRPLVAGLLTALVSVFVTGVTGVLWQWQRAEQKREDAVLASAAAKNAYAAADRAWADEKARRTELEIQAYFQRIALAYHEWLQSNVARAEQLLDECPPDLRHWEWHYVKRLCNSALLTLRGHTMPLGGMAISGDGKLLATSTGRWGRRPGEVKLWDATTGRELWTRRDFPGPVASVAFSPDGQRLASACSVLARRDADAVRVWDTSTGQEILNLPAIGGVFGVAFSPDGQKLATAGADGKVRLWNIRGEKADRSNLPENSPSLNEPVVLDLRAGPNHSPGGPKPDVQDHLTLSGHTGNVFDVAFSADGQRLASASRDGTARLWEVSTGIELARFEGLEDARQVAFSPDSQWLAVATFDGIIKIWDVTGEAREVASHRVRPGPTAVAFSPNSQWLAVGGGDGVARIWEAQSGHELASFRGHGGRILKLAFTPDARRLVSTGNDRTVKFWDISALSLPKGPGDQLWAVMTQQAYLHLISPGRHVPSFAFSRDSGAPGQIALVGSARDPTSVHVWNMAATAFDGRNLSLRSRGYGRHSDRVTSVAVSPNAGAPGRLASAALDKTAIIWDTQTRKPIFTLVGHTATVTCVAYSPDGKQLATSSEDSTIKLWDAQTGGLNGTLEGHTAAVLSVAFSPDGVFVASASGDETVRVWELAGRREIATLRAHTGPVQTAVWNPGPGKPGLETAGEDGMIHLWDSAAIRSGARLPSPRMSLRGHTMAIDSICFSPDGWRLASLCGTEETVKLWDVQHGYEAITFHDVPTKASSFVSFSLDGHMLAASGTLGLVLWFDDYWQYRARRGTRYGELHDWDRAAAEYAHAMELGANQPGEWLKHARLLLQQADRDGYRKFCQSLLDTHGETNDANMANEVAWACVLAPDALSDPGRVVTLADRAVAGASDRNRHLYLNTLGASLYRTGRFSEAIEKLNESMAAQGTGGLVHDWLFLAMAHQRLGQEAEARGWFEKAVQYIEGQDKDPHSPLSWQWRIELVLLRNEAAALFRPVAPPSGSDAPP